MMIYDSVRDGGSPGFERKENKDNYQITMHIITVVSFRPEIWRLLKL